MRGVDGGDDTRDGKQETAGLYTTELGRVGKSVVAVASVVGGDKRLMCMACRRCGGPLSLVRLIDVCFLFFATTLRFADLVRYLTLKEVRKIVIRHR